MIIVFFNPTIQQSNSPTVQKSDSPCQQQLIGSTSCNSKPPPAPLEAL